MELPHFCGQVKMRSEKRGVSLCRAPLDPTRRSSGRRLSASRGACDKSVPALAADLGISSAALRHWLRQADADEGRVHTGLSNTPA